MKPFRPLFVGLALVVTAVGATAWFYFGANPLAMFEPKQEESVASIDDETEIVGGGEAGGSFEFQTTTGRWGEEPVTTAPVEDSEALDLFAQCLTAQGITMYGAYWCPHCAAQKELFGDSFAYVNYVECDEGGENPEPERCAAAGIEYYPTWIDATGEKTVGEQSFSDLAEISACELPS